ncbi:hypothetical protein SUDANB32_04018 [Streptomyces sp. enrichment culture]
MPRPAHAPARPPGKRPSAPGGARAPAGPAVLLWRGARHLTAAGVTRGPAAVTAGPRVLVRRSPRPGAPACSRRPAAGPRARRVGASSHARAHAPRDAVDSPAG